MSSIRSEMHKLRNPKSDYGKACLIFSGHTSLIVEVIENKFKILEELNKKLEGKIAELELKLETKENDSNVDLLKFE